jgi:molybdenum cofactor cytidylyltransferase
VLPFGAAESASGGAESASGGATILEAVVASALRACSRVLLVTGYRGAELVELFHDRPRVVLVENRDWHQGMFSSIRCGIARVDTRRFFVTLGDMPWITPAVYGALLRHEAADIVFPVHDGRRGHPVLFHERTRAAVAAADPARGSMREIASSFRVSEMSWPDDSVLRDIDRESDLG